MMNREYSEEVKISNRANKKTLLKDFSKATKRELECLYYFAVGKNANEVGEILAISKRTAESHVQNLKIKVDVRKLAELIFYATKQQLI